MYYVCRPSPCGGNGRADIAKIRHMPHLGRKRFGNTPRFPGALVSQVCSLASAGVLLRWHRFATGLVVLCPETPGRTSLRDMPSRARQGDGRSRMSLAPLGPGTVVRHRPSFEPLLSSGDWAGGMVSTCRGAPLRSSVSLAGTRVACLPTARGYLVIVVYRRVRISTCPLLFPLAHATQKGDAPCRRDKRRHRGIPIIFVPPTLHTAGGEGAETARQDRRARASLMRLMAPTMFSSLVA